MRARFHTDAITLPARVRVITLAQARGSTGTVATDSPAPTFARVRQPGGAGVEPTRVSRNDGVPYVSAARRNRLVLNVWTCQQTKGLTPVHQQTRWSANLRREGSGSDGSPESRGAAAEPSSCRSSRGRGQVPQ